MNPEPQPTIQIDPQPPAAGLDPTATGGGKCYSPASTKKARCAWHKHSDPKLKQQSSCTHPTFGHPLTAKEVQEMKECVYYTPSDAGNVTEMKAAIRKLAEQSGADFSEVPQPGESISTQFKQALVRKNEVKIGREMIDRWEDESRPDVLVPKLSFKYIDNVDKTQGSVLEFVARSVKDNDIAVLIGHLGSGKTTGVMEVAARANAPLTIINCDGQLTVEQIIGSRVPSVELIDPTDPSKGAANTLIWRDAPLLEAYRLGYWACIDDYTFTGSDVFSAIFGLMTNQNYQIQSTGEIVPRHPNFRLFLTTNPPEYMELYPNRQQPDAAFLSRIQSRFWVEYLPEAEERQVMRNAAPVISEDALNRMMRVISMSREYLRRGDLNFAFSTRHAVNWAKKVQRLGDIKRAAWESFLADMDSESKSVMQDKILDTQL